MNRALPSRLGLTGIDRLSLEDPIKALSGEGKKPSWQDASIVMPAADAMWMDSTLYLKHFQQRSEAWKEWNGYRVVRHMSMYVCFRERRATDSSNK